MTAHECRGQVFGVWDAPITDDDEPIATPVGSVCAWCQQAVKEGDNGRIAAAGFTEHRECSLRNAMGGIGHLVDHARYCRGELGTDAGLSRRQSSLLAWEFLHDTGFFAGREATAEQRQTWMARLCREQIATPED
ncbi:MAG: hypothetical protein ABSB73_09210 [Solirubrobacteraceae bacterium]|jgi:hypothetical protein